jgi:hypothetical protein
MQGYESPEVVKEDCMRRSGGGQKRVLRGDTQTKSRLVSRNKPGTEEHLREMKQLEQTNGEIHVSRDLQSDRGLGPEMFKAGRSENKGRDIYRTVHGENSGMCARI